MSRITLKLPKSMIKWFEIGKKYRSRSDLSTIGYQTSGFVFDCGFGPVDISKRSDNDSLALLASFPWFWLPPLLSIFSLPSLALSVLSSWFSMVSCAVPRIRCSWPKLNFVTRLAVMFLNNTRALLALHSATPDELTMAVDSLFHLQGNDEISHNYYGKAGT